MSPYLADHDAGARLYIEFLEKRGLDGNNGSWTGVPTISKYYVPDLLSVRTFTFPHPRIHIIFRFLSFFYKDLSTLSHALKSETYLSTQKIVVCIFKTFTELRTVPVWRPKA